MFWRKARMTGEKIAWVAVAIDSREEFERRAHQAAQELGPSGIGKLASYFHHPPSKPEEATDRFNGLGEWMDICQAAIFEIYYNSRETALPALRSSACGEYDWTQTRAIGVLCRLAFEGIERDRIAEEIRTRIQQWRY
jgi:hypothetical protein